MNPSPRIPGTRPPKLAPGRSRQRGVTLLDSLVAMMILTFGLLGLTQFQVRIVKSGSEAQSRLVATRFADELLSTMLVDSNNAGCYVLPTPQTNCASGTARGLAADWRTRTLAALPNATIAAALDGAATRFRVTITWSGLESAEQRRLEMSSDVR